MRIIALVLRIAIIFVGFKMLVISGWTPDTAPFCSGIGFILVGVYLGLQSIKGPKATLCPLVHGVKGGGGCNK